MTTCTITTSVHLTEDEPTPRASTKVLTTMTVADNKGRFIPSMLNPDETFPLSEERIRLIADNNDGIVTAAVLAPMDRFMSCYNDDSDYTQVDLCHEIAFGSFAIPTAPETQIVGITPNEEFIVIYSFDLTEYLAYAE